MLKTHRLAALAAVLVIGSVTPARAIPVTYSTSGIFGQNGTNVATLAEGGVTVTYIPVTQNYDPSPGSSSFANFGSFTVTGTADAFARFSSPQVDTFTLTVNQSMPTPGGSATFDSTVNGTITFNPMGFGRSEASITFSTLSRTIGNVTYEIFEGDVANPGRVLLFIGAQSSIDGRVSIVTPVPEPGTMALACAALPLLGLGYARRYRRLAKAKV